MSNSDLPSRPALPILRISIAAMAAVVGLLVGWMLPRLSDAPCETCGNGGYVQQAYEAEFGPLRTVALPPGK